MKLIKETVIPASICDPNVVLSVKGAFDLVQDFLTEMMGELHIDGVTLREKYGCVWVFTRNRMQIDRAPGWMERCVIESYISSARGAKMTVDTVLKDSEGKICLYSRIEMCALDLKTQKIKRIRDVGVTSDTHVEAPERDIEFSRLRHEGLSDIGTLVVQSGDIDFVQHTNNVSYVRFVMNTYSVKELRERPVREIEVRYAGQTHEGDTLTIRKATVGAKELFDIAEGDRTAVECEIIR
ncbi:MAG: hypothetical protein IJ171_03485 [Ruminococcus sp.]|jgi:acyl-CoA thioesterase FadM|nr:hypothetical protein [Ruminococcus sp.]